MDWITEIGKYKVEKKESARPSGQAYLHLIDKPSFCVHTTEGDTVDGAWATLNNGYMAPHFLVGQDRIVQMRPLWAQAATLVSHNDRFIQVEVVGHAKTELHQLTPSSWEPLVALTKFVHEQLGVPLVRPWPDLLGSGIWASNNPRRQSGDALTVRGVFGHVDVPDQGPTWHWDPGSLNYTALFAAALGDEMTDEQKAQLDKAFQVVRAVDDFLGGKQPEDLPADAGTVRIKALKALLRAASLPKAPAASLPDHTHEAGPVVRA